jgi:hypothetical protein
MAVFTFFPRADFNVRFPLTDYKGSKDIFSFSSFSDGDIPGKDSFLFRFF